MKKAIQTILAEHKGKLLASSLVTLLPALAGRWMMWESLALLAAHWLVLLVVFSDRRNRKGQSRKAVGLVFWVMPFTSLLTGGAAAVYGGEGTELKYQFHNYVSDINGEFLAAAARRQN